MTNKIVAGFVAVAVLYPCAASAQVVITEIMYDLQSGSDSGREWIEVFNTGTALVSLAAWKLLENGTNHKINVVSGGASLAPGAYAVIAGNTTRFRTDWPQFTGQLFDSAFSLSNDGESISLHDASSTDMNLVSYQSSWGAAGDGNSLNRSPGETGAFIPKTPSPGAPMSANAIPPPPPKAALIAKTKIKTSAKPKSKSQKASPTYSGDAASDTPIVGTIGGDSATTELAAGSAVLPSSNISSLWWAAAGALALAAAGALAAAKHFGKREWSIVEEK